MKLLDKDQISKLLSSDEARKIQGLSWLFGYDNNQNLASSWDDSELKVLIAFLAPGNTRSVSSTYTCLNALIKSEPGVFVDFSYFPAKEDSETFQKLRLPFLFGNVSHRPAQDYDLVIISISVLMEFLNLFHSLEKSGIPIYHNQRYDDRFPLIIAGGIPMSELDSLGGKSGIPDLIFLGQGEKSLVSLVQLLKKKKAKVGDLQAPKVRKSLIKSLVTSCSSYYYPDGYEVTYRKDNISLVESIKPKYDWVPEKLEIFLVHDFDSYPGFVYKIFSADGSNATNSDFIVSFGCSSGGACNFCIGEDEKVTTKNGPCKIKYLKENVEIATPQGWKPVLKIFDIGVKTSYKIVLKNGMELICGEDHLFKTTSSAAWVSAENLTTDHFVLVNKTHLEIYSRLNFQSRVHSVEKIDPTHLYDLEVSSPHEYYAEGMLVHNCAEGNVMGGWREGSIDNLKKMMDDTRLYSACNILGIYSFNLSYYGRFIDMMYEGARRFSRIKLFNMRVDMIASRPDYFSVGVALGVMKAAAPIEGFGHRMRNLIYNKSLSREQMMQAFRTFFEYRLMVVKTGFVISGHETQDDWDDAASELEEILAIKKEVGSSAGLRANITPLVYYPQTPLRYLKRKSAINSLYEIRSMKDFIQQFKRRIRFKFNAPKFNTFVQQMSLDLGRLGTPIWEKITKSGFYYYDSISTAVKEVVVSEVEKLYNIKVDAFLDEKPADYKSPVDFISVKKPKYLKLVQDSLGKKQLFPCTKTASHPKPKCYDCGYCKDKKTKDSILKRNITSEKNVNDVTQALFNNKHLSTMRVAFQVDKKAFALSKVSLAFFVGSKILQTIEDPSTYHSIQNVSNSACELDNLRDWSYGNFFFDMRFNSMEPPLNVSTKEINSNLSVCSVTHIARMPKFTNLLRTNKLMFKFSIAKSRLDISSKVRNWKGTCKVLKKGLTKTFIVSLKTVPLLRDDFSIYVKESKYGSDVVVILPIRIPPINFIHTLFNCSYQLAQEMALIYSFGCFGGENLGVCKNCGGATELYLNTSEVAPYCIKCFSNMLLKKNV